MAGGALVWVGRVVSGLVSALFLMSATMKFTGGPQVVEGFAHLGLPQNLMLPLGVLELACVVVYLVPPTAVLGAVLLTGYIGGAICTHLRVGDPLVLPGVVGLCVWLGLYLREERLKELLPLRRD